MLSMPQPKISELQIVKLLNDIKSEFARGEITSRTIFDTRITDDWYSLFLTKHQRNKLLK